MSFTTFKQYLNASIPDQCEVMKSTFEHQLVDQRKHLKDCQMCRMIRSQIDIHPNKGWPANLCFDASLIILLDGFSNRHSPNPTVNNCPFINQRFGIDSSGGFFISIGKSSHSTIKINGTSSCTFKPKAGYFSAKYFLLFSLCSSIQAGQGTIFVEFKQFHNYAATFLLELQQSQPNKKPLKYLNQAAEILKFYCRRHPNNIIDSDKPSPCGLALYNSIYYDSKLTLCNICNNSNCKINCDLANIVEAIAKVIIHIQCATVIKLDSIFPNALINYFRAKNCCNSNDGLSFISDPNQLIPQNLF